MSSTIPWIVTPPPPEVASELVVLLEGLLIGGLPNLPIDLSFKVGLYRPTVRKTGSYAPSVRKRGQP